MVGKVVFGVSIMMTLVTTVVAPILLVTVEAEWLRLGVMASVSTTVVLLTAFFMPETESERRVQFFRAVRPLGWWRSTAREPSAGPEAPVPSPLLPPYPLLSPSPPWPFRPGNQLFSFRAGLGAASGGASFFGRPSCG